MILHFPGCIPIIEEWKNVLPLAQEPDALFGFYHSLICSPIIGQRPGQVCDMSNLAVFTIR